MSKYEKLGAELGRLVDQKKAAYGDSFGKSGEILRILYPNGVKPADYTNLLTVTRVIDKLFRIATDEDAFGESPWGDVAGYALRASSKERGKEPESPLFEDPWVEPIARIAAMEVYRQEGIDEADLRFVFTDRNPTHGFTDSEIRRIDSIMQGMGWCIASSRTVEDDTLREWRPV